MKSPFQIFRTHQKIMMVILVGLSMIGFVLMGAVPDPTNMPSALVFIVVISVVAGAAWIAGMPAKNSSEYATWGVILRVGLAFVITMTGGPRPVLRAETGDLTVEDLSNLRRYREAANQFVVSAIA